MNETLMTATLQSIKEKLEKIDYGKIVIIKYGKNKVDIEEHRRERIELDEKDSYKKG